MNRTEPKVSVTVVTYNHGEWLAECLESIVSQNTVFPFEVIVGDDASTDGKAREALARYAREYPDVVLPILRDKNIGPSANYFDVVGRARGTYIAYIDGDDVMLPGKLQRQADVLDGDSGVAFVVHPMVDMKSDTRLVQSPSNVAGKGGVRFASIENLLREGCFFSHGSKMYRRSAIVTRSSDEPVVDYYLHLEHSVGGKIAIMDDVLGGHRRHPGGVSKMPEYRHMIAAAYDRAFRYALDLGVDEAVVGYGRIRYKQGKALSALALGDYAEFSANARIDEELKRYSTLPQRALDKFARFPRCVQLAQYLRGR